MSYDYDYPPSSDPDPSDHPSFYEDSEPGPLFYPVRTPEQWRCLYCNERLASWSLSFCGDECEARDENRMRRWREMDAELQARHASKAVETIREGIV